MDLEEPEDGDDSDDGRPLASRAKAKAKQLKAKRCKIAISLTMFLNSFPFMGSFFSGCSFEIWAFFASMFRKRSYMLKRIYCSLFPFYIYNTVSF